MTSRGESDTEAVDVAPRVVARAVEVETRLGPNLRIELFGSATEVQRGDAMIVVVPVSALGRGALDPYLPRLAEGRIGVVIVGELPYGFLATLPESVIVAHVTDLASADGLYVALAGALDRVELRASGERRARWLNRYRYELGEIIEISRALSQERDIDRLLGLILERSRQITGADAGSIYVVDVSHVRTGAVRRREKRLRFKLSQNDSVEFQSGEFSVPLTTTSIAGAAAVMRRTINIPDVYELAAPADPNKKFNPLGTILPSSSEVPFYSFDPSFDRKLGYRTKSMIALPMISAEEEVIGVIQLINRKRDPRARLTVESVEAEVLAFDQRSEDLLATLAAQAGIALENALLYDEIRKIFEGFVRASVQAIEQRDPTTSGHSLRVSVLSVALAEAVDRADAGPFARAKFSKRELKELEYASLLHDFGKIGVREEVLVKAKKLYPHQLREIGLRLDYARARAELDHAKKKIELLQQGAPAEFLTALDVELAQRLAALEADHRTILEANEPTVLKEGDFTRIADIGARTYIDACGHFVPLLAEDEVTSLQVTRGSLHEKEIAEIRSHVVHTKNFLTSIPWGKNFEQVPEIAGAHHERLNGTGYPEGRTSDHIPLASKIMTIADIFDALTARDRPYKRAMPVAKALDILGFEVKDGHVDKELVRIFSEATVYRAVEGIEGA